MVKIRTIYWLLLIGFCLRLGLSPFGTYQGDMNAWIGWSNRLIEVGFGKFYDAWCDYLPGYLYVLFILGQIKNFLAFLKIDIPPQVLFKMPSIFADLASAFLIFKLGKKWFPKVALFPAAFYIFNPAVLANSTLWGQADSFFTFFLLLSFYLLFLTYPPPRSASAHLGGVFSAISFSFTCLIKPQGLIFLPLFLIKFLKDKDFKKIYFYLLTFWTVFLIAFIPFANGKNIFSFIITRFQQTLNQYPYTSLNAFNFWTMINFGWKSDSLKFLGVSLKNWGMLIFVICYARVFVSLLFVKKREVFFQKLSLGIALVSLVSFLFLTRVHERHLFPAFAFLTLAVGFSKIFLFALAGFSLLYCLNLFYAYSWLTQNFKMIFPPFFISFFSLIEILIFFFLFVYLDSRRFRSVKKNLRILHRALLNWTNSLHFPFTSEEPLRVTSEVSSPLSNRLKMLIILILLFSFSIRLFRLGHPQEHFFDEVYHAFTAQEMVRGNKAAWEWWNKSPEGFAYEWTHPPMAKLLMSLGILTFGQNPFAWRLPAAIFGTGVIFLIYLLTREIFRSEKIALLSALLASLDGLMLVMSRIGMSDIYFLFFTLLTIYFALKQRWFLSGIFLGCALGTKWTGLYIYPVIGLIFGENLILQFKKTKKPIVKLLNCYIVILLSYILVPLVIYVFSYTLFFTSGHSLSQFWGLQKQMWWYHIGLKATHNYQSPAWSWPFMIRPVWLWVKYEKDFIGNIYAMGNPLIWWAGLASVPLALISLVEKKSWPIFLTLFCYFILFLPWFASPRIMFLYHYLPSLPFLIMLLAWTLNRVMDIGKVGKQITIYYLLITFFLFLFFYPHWTGLVVPQKLANFYFWLPSWK